MRVALSLIASIFLGIASAGVVPGTAGRNTTVAHGQGGPSAPVNSVYSHPSESAFPTGTSVHPIPSDIHSGFPASGMGAKPSIAHSFYPMSPVSNPTGSQPHHSGAPTGVSDHPTPSAQGHPHPSFSPGAQLMDGGSRSATHHNAIANGTYSHPSALPTSVKHRSGLPSGVSGHPAPTDVQGHESGFPSDASVHPKPTTSYA